MTRQISDCRAVRLAFAVLAITLAIAAEQVGPLRQQGRAEEAEKLIVEALKLAGEEPSKGKEDSPRDKRTPRRSPDSGL